MVHDQLFQSFYLIFLPVRVIFGSIFSQCVILLLGNFLTQKLIASDYTLENGIRTLLAIVRLPDSLLAEWAGQLGLPHCSVT